MGQERITQPTVFYGPISALGGIYPPVGFGAALSSSFSAFFKAWSLTGDGITTNFSIYTDEIILPYSENFIVTIDGVFQPPSFYTIDAYYKQIQFQNPIPDSSVANVVQIATVKDSLPYKYSFNTWTFSPTANTSTFVLCAVPTTLSPFKESYIVSLDGVIQCPGTDFNVNAIDQTLTFTSLVPSGIYVRVQQIGALSGGNTSLYYISGSYLPLAGGDLLGNLTVKGNVSASNTVFASTISAQTYYVNTINGSQIFAGTNVQNVTGNSIIVKGGNIRVDGVDLSNVPNITAFDTDGQSLFDLRSAAPSANYNLSIASSGVNNFMKFFGGRDGDPKPFIVVKTGQPLRFASYSNFFNTGNNFTEYARVDTSTGNFGVGTQTPNQRLTVSGNISSTQTVFASALQLNNATTLPGNALTSSLSSLLININGQQFRIPLLAP